MPRAGWVKPSDDQRLSDHVAIGVLTRTFPPELVDAVLADTGRREVRSRRLPARLVTYYVMALSLFSSSGYEEVMRSLVEGLAWESGWRQRWEVPSQPALTQARTRLGPQPLEELFSRACIPLATEVTRGAFWRSLRLVGMDGTSLDVADSPDNVASFGRPTSGRGTGEGAFPKLRMVALAECGTHAIFAAAMGGYTTSSEASLARQLLGSLGPGMLVLADRYYCSFPLVSAVAATGAELCWRAKANAALPVLELHDDGSYASELVSSDDKARAHPVAVRVVEYAIDDPGRPQAEATRYRLVTTLLDPAAAPAAELAALYAQRWEFESALDELKTHQRGPGVVLRSKTAEGVRQEAWGYLCTHYALRALMANAADGHHLDPDRISFTRTLAAARRSVRAGLGTDQATLACAMATAIAEIVAVLVPLRRLRAAARVVKRKMSNYRVKGPSHHHWPQPTRPIAGALRVIDGRAGP